MEEMTSQKNINIKSQWSIDSLSKGVYSFLNLASVGQFLEMDNSDSEIITFYSDGGLLCKLVKLLTGKNIQRVSFDFTSIANEVFKYCESNNLSIFFIGAEQKEIELFVDKISCKYPDLIINGYSSGYFDNSTLLAQQIIDSGSNMVVVGMGAGKQEGFLIELFKMGFDGHGFSCGGFIRQFSTTSNDKYYPNLINTLKLRAFYRMYKEPHTIKRYAFSYPYNVLSIVYKKLTNKITIRVN
jgi:N-acetylglucosaminyldiphosphoundecaprenol N-acetyl-beta-D-mannosaminyltransferase